MALIWRSDREAERARRRSDREAERARKRSVRGGARRRRRRNAAFAMVREGDGGEQECARWYAVVREGGVNEKSCDDKHNQRHKLRKIRVSFQIRVSVFKIRVLLI
ncbi:hypothetical protein PHAVU_006G025100 [Phaseolus vulgaris]|uniref:Uncharacterized protein n=1 Tax=Phaseolus vulgaris TaxID=3885 RepID=V7BJW2_PHAVU|nr:hypothetical protein PHAVU_006G025100g [Phaseolus vulgaris]ESW18247.1 hypothetical protein PHAVU_006G025100g [Phaseolus vulgaris]